MTVLYADDFQVAQKVNFQWYKLSDFKISLLAAIACYFSDWLIVSLVWNTMYDLCKEKSDSALRLIKTKKSSDKCY